MKMLTIVSAFLFGMGKASINPIKWSMTVRMCWFPDVETFSSVTKSMVILLKGKSGISIICNGYICIFAFSLLHKAQ